jgi:hypothetical protein
MSEGIGGVRAGKGGFITGRRLGWSAGAVALVYVAALASQLMGHSWLLKPHQKNCIDFTWIWLSGKFALSADPVRVYAHPVFAAARAALVGPPNCYIGSFDYPPTLLFFVFPLGLLPYSIAFAVWVAATLLFYLAAIYAIIPRSAAVVAALAPFPVYFNVFLGHTGFLTAGLLGFALVSVETRPWLSGIFLGLLSYKPQFGILFPFVLLVSRDWTVLRSAVITTIAAAAAAAIVFGLQTWPAFVASLADRATSVSADRLMAAPLVSLFGFLSSIGAAPLTAWAAQLAVSAIVVARVCYLWAQPIPYPLKAAALAIGSILAAPHVIGYDACILSIGVAFLVKDGLARGFLRGERAALFACWAGMFLLAGPIPIIVCIILLILVARRAAPVWPIAAAMPDYPIAQRWAPLP